MTRDNKIRGFVKDLEFAFQFRIPSYSSQKFNAYECTNQAMIIVAENIANYDMWSVYNKDLIKESFQSGLYESNVKKEYIENFLKIFPETPAINDHVTDAFSYSKRTSNAEDKGAQVTKPMADYQRECIVSGEMPKQGLERILEITTKSKVQIGISEGTFELYSDFLAEPVKVYTEQQLLEMLKAILILEKTYAGK